MIWLTMLLLFFILLSLFVKSSREHIEEERVLLLSDCLSWEKGSEYGNYQDYNRLTVQKRYNYDKYIVIYETYFDEIARDEYASDSVDLHLISKRTYDYSYKYGAVDVNKWYENYLFHLKHADVDDIPLALQVEDSTGRVLMTTDSSSSFKSRNNLVHTTPLVVGMEYPHRVVAYFERTPFYQGLELPIIFATLFLVVFLLCGYLLLRVVSRSNQFLNSKLQGVLYIKNDFQKPLNEMFGHLDILYNELDEQQRPFIRVLKASLGKVSSAIKTMLDNFSEGEVALNDFSLTITQILSILVEQYTTIYSNVTINSSVTPDSDKHLFDTTYFPAMLNNLIDNAIKYNNSELIVLNVSFRVIGDRWELIVEDNGMGIERDKIRYIFAPYYRVKSESTKFRSGMGLGLTFVKRVVDAYNGDIHVESEVGKGTKFTIRGNCY